MFPVDIDQPASPIEIAQEFAKQQTPIVRTVALDELSFQRKETKSQDTAQILELINGESHKALKTKTEQQGVEFAEQYMRTALNGIAHKIEAAEIKARYVDSDMPIKEYMEVLNYASSEDLLHVTATLYTLSLADSSVHTFIVDKIDNALHFFNIFEKHTLLEVMLKQPGSESVHGMIALLLRSSEDLNELHRLVDGIGVTRLCATNDGRVHEFVAQAVLMPALLEINFGKPLPQSASPAEVQARFVQLEKGYEDVKKICSEYPEFSKTQAVKDFIHTADDSLLMLKIERAEHVVRLPQAPALPTVPVAPKPPAGPESELLAGDVRAQATYYAELEVFNTQLEEYEQSLASYRTQLVDFLNDWNEYEKTLAAYHAENIHAENALREIANVYTLAASLEFRFGVNITYGTGDYLGITEKKGDILHQREGRWTSEQVLDIARVLEAIPEDHLVFSPLLREIQRVDSLGSAFAARYVDGVVKIANSTINSQYIEAAYDGENSLVMVLAHELGHSIQIGAGPSWFRETEDGKHIIEIGENRYDFDEWMSLSGWEIIDSNRWSGGGWLPLVLDGTVVEIGVPIEHAGKEIVLVPMGRGILASFDAEAGFSHDPYSHASPWEDFAEAFCEYLFLPERLIEHAPEKFLHLELELRKYERHKTIQALLTDAIDKARSK